ncbi:YopJ/AvrA family T3SS effector serine/threonine acetyltransferase [Bartonella taylorii]|uniref:YopJ/AvrA family T3SS effector serine/threonine acetyltransferase n=1 Tax=Bartonella taylorii TaxID=33046 RepID=UPI001ABBD5AE|nr:YopJ/AvrA family T3SS effector serine/threonine acetyltransferase [Bartonella taylorii]
MPKLVDLLNKIRGSFKKEDNATPEGETLESIIARLESDITDGSWIYVNDARTDLRMMPALVEQANRKYPPMKLKFSATPKDLAISIKNAINDGIQSSRFIANIRNDGGIHFAVIDHKVINNKASLILFESATLNHTALGMFAVMAKTAFEKYRLPHCYFSIVEMDIQRSSYECGIFSLALAKKLYLESDKLEKIHKDNIDGVLYEPDTPFLSYDKLDKYLPVTFYKHTQSVNRLNKYLKSNPGAENEIINKKDQTIFERFDNNSTVIGDKKLSVSPHKKRIYEYKSLMR